MQQRLARSLIATALVVAGCGSTGPSHWVSGLKPSPTAFVQLISTDKKQRACDPYKAPSAVAELATLGACATIRGYDVAPAHGGPPDGSHAVSRVRVRAPTPPTKSTYGDDGNRSTSPTATVAGVNRRVTVAMVAATGAGATTVQVGLERVGSSAAAWLRGKRVGLIVNGASVTENGTPSLDVLRAHGIHVLRLFTPEHGLGGTAGPGVAQGDYIDPRSGLPVVSLYGDHTMPTRADLAGLDALVYDLQGVGVRYFTYGSTEILAMDAAARAGIRFVVLDRPDPLGGTLVEGPVNERPPSFVTTVPGPLVNGLTEGELARYVNAHLRIRARLLVIPMAGWRRQMTWAQTGRRWIAPSPNLGSPDAALLYPGTGLLEATNVSEGRGSSAPFQTICAPWLDTRRVIGDVTAPDVKLTATTLVPRASVGAPAPKYVGVSCPGIYIQVQRTSIDGFRFGLLLLRVLQHQPHFVWLDGGAQIDSLLGTSRLRQALDGGDSVEAIIASEAAPVDAWRRAVRPFLLYR